MRYSLRTLVILMLLAGPFCTWCWWKYSAYVEWKAREAAIAEIKKSQVSVRLKLGTAVVTSPVPVPPEWSEMAVDPPRKDPVTQPLTLEEARQQLKESMTSAPRLDREEPDHMTGTFPKRRAGETIRVGK